MKVSGISLGRYVLQPYLIADADEFAQRLDVQSGLPKQNLQVGTRQSLRLVSSLKQSLNDVVVHARLLSRADLSGSARWVRGPAKASAA